VKQPKVTFVYLGRSPAFGSFVTDLARAARGVGHFDKQFIVAAGTALTQELRDVGAPVVDVPTFSAATVPHVAMGYLRARQRIMAELSARRPDAVVTLMPHVWSPFMNRRIRRLGIHYATIIHDAEPHPGDPTAWATRWLARDARRADIVFTLSRTVASRLVELGTADQSQIVPLFHPDLGTDGVGTQRRREPGQPLKVLFFGRILAYKGLSLLIDAVEMARRGGLAIELGVAGAGPLGANAARLAALEARIINRWLTQGEIGELLAGYDVMACSHIEASQSGVAALAFGNGMPVVATPVGGVAEQVIPGKTGVLARDVSARALADAFAELARNPELCAGMRAHLAATRPDRSMQRFLASMLDALNLAATETAAPPCA
jgi:glycosyltransferase involved in cell wall biosynthesis